MNTTVYKNASIVTGLSIAERALGFLYRIVLSRLIGAEGLGLYQVALSLFSLFLTIGTGGLPVTVSRMIAKSNAKKEKGAGSSVLAAGVILSLLLSLPFCLLLWLFGSKMTFLFSDMRSFPVFRILLIGLCFACVYAVIRGYFWGNKQFLTASLLEMSEEIIMVLTGLLLLNGVNSPAAGAEKAAWASAIADGLSCVLALLCFFFVGGKLSRPKKALKPLFNATMPITSVRASASLVNSAIAVLLPAMLIQSGVEQAKALQLFGIVSGMVVPVLFTPSTLIGSLALVLVPELSEDYYRQNTPRLRKNVERGLRFAFLVACALIPFFFVLGEDIGRLAFSNAVAGEIIAKSCPILLPMSLTMISTSMLNSIGFEKQTFLFFFLGAAALLLSILFLPPLCGVYAYIVGLGASYVVTAICNLVFLRKKCPFLKKERGQVWVEPIFFALLTLLPLTLLGQLFRAIFAKCTGEILTLALTALAMAGTTLLVYSLLKITPKLSLKKRKRGKKEAF